MKPLSRGARLCEQIIRHAKARKGGVRQCGRSYLARRLGCSTRTVSRYVRELRDAGRLEVTPPRKTRTPHGWRTTEVNRYRLPCRPNLAPHVHKRRPTRGDTPVTPSPNGDRVTRPSGRVTPPPVAHQHTNPPRDPALSRAAARAAIHQAKAK